MSPQMTLTGGAIRHLGGGCGGFSRNVSSRACVTSDLKQSATQKCWVAGVAGFGVRSRNAGARRSYVATRHLPPPVTGTAVTS